MNNDRLSFNIIIDKLSLLGNEKEYEIDVLSDDLNDVKFSGNKLWKLKYNILTARTRKFKILLTFGGAFSNHISAVAEAGKNFNFNTIGVIRGEVFFPLNPTLEFAKGQGMEFLPISRQEYRKKANEDFIASLNERFHFPYIIPEGGTNTLAMKGCAEISEKVAGNYDYICVACGTGGTIAGLVAGAHGKGKVLGFPILKGGDFLRTDIQQLLDDYGCDYTNWELFTDYHFGGYAKFKPELVDFINEFKEKQNIQLDPIYTGKMVYGVMDLVKKDYFPKGSKILIIHTGGLQGIEGFNQRYGNLINV